MQAFEIKTNKSDYPYLVIASGFKKAAAAMQALITGGMTSANEDKYLSVEWWKGEGVAKCVVTFANALIDELKRIGD